MARLRGNSDNNTIKGTSASDRIEGNGGDDILYGLLGNDELRGGSGMDTLYGGDGIDELRGESGNDKLFGDAGNDELEGGSGNDVLDGGAGRDWLEGGSGNDILTGGSSSDIFKFDDAFFNGADVITDFQDGSDRVKIELPDGATFQDLTIGTNAAGDAVVGWELGTVTLTGVSAGQLTATDFLF